MVNWITDHIGVSESAVNIGVLKNKESLVLIDTGIDNSAINKVRKQLDTKVTAALITHHHADHMGGANKLEKLGVTDIYGPSLELPFIHQTLLEPMTMFGGSNPPELLRNRHLEARPAPTVKSTEHQDHATVISCPGHTPDHQSYLVENTIFTGDSAFTQETIDKYHLLFAVNPGQAQSSIENIKSQNFDTMIPGHGPVQYSRKDALTVLNDTERHYKMMRDKILEIIGEKILMSNYLNKSMKELDLMSIIKSRGYLQYILYQVPLQGYISNLLDDGEIFIEIESKGPVLLAN